MSIRSLVILALAAALAVHPVEANVIAVATSEGLYVCE